MPKILITGANGQLGNEIKKISNNFKYFDFIFTDVDDLDITDIKKIEDFYYSQKFDFIVNCAAYTAVDKAETEPEIAEKINAFAVKNLAEISRENKIPLVHISTDYVFDGKSKIPYKEDDAVNPQSVYGKTKLKGEEFAKTAYEYFIIRTSWLYSSFGNNFVKTILRLGREREELKIVSDQTGSPTYAEDLAFAVLKMLQKISGFSGSYSGIYHFSDEGSCSWYEFAKEITKISGIDCNILPISTEEYPVPAKRPEYSLLDKSKIKTTFDIDIPFWKDSLKRCLKELL
ncbi:MAG: dTDP-4-dehydrorhamnose reductase [Chlorobi bacterium]|nr:dTDP-4-dehydrorhamnose reductase [Chlorobiota bacterium]